MNNPERIAAYCRVSTDKEEQVSSLAAQQDFFTQYAQKTGCQLIKLYTDEGKSGTKFKNRPAFQEMMADASKGLFDCVYVKDVSRLSRNVVDFLQSIRTLKSMGIDCRFITSNMSLSDGELTLTILAAVAQEESANLSKRVKFGKKKNAQMGKVPNFVFGYDKAPNDCFHLTINTQEASVVRQIFTWYQEGMGTYKIASLLRQKNIHTKRGYDFSPNAVLRILKSKLYIGEVINGKEEICDFLTSRRRKTSSEKWCITKDQVPSIISSTQFEIVQQMIHAKEIPENFRYQTSHHLFSSLILCSECHYPFRLLSRKEHQWVCRGRNQYGISFCQNGIKLSEKELLNSILTHIKSYIPNMNEFILQVKTETERLLSQKNAADSSAEIQKQLKEYQHKRAKQISLFEADIITLQEAKRAISSCDKSIENLEVQLTNIQKSSPLWPENFWTSDMLFSEELWDNLLLKSMIQSIDASPAKVTITFSDLNVC